MKCCIQECPGQYEARRITHTVRPQGRLMVIDHVPADVCDVCGDTLLSPETLRQLETLLKHGQPAHSVPLYEYA
jgi:YgiT-type zinc finger domain-containing protein